MDRVNGRPCYCSIGAGGTPCIDRKYCDALREIERLRAALDDAKYLSAEVKSDWEKGRVSVDSYHAALAFDKALQEDE